MIDIDATGPTAPELVNALADQGVHVFAVSERRVRVVTHLDVNRSEVETAGEVFRQAVGKVAVG